MADTLMELIDDLVDWAVAKGDHPTTVEARTAVLEAVEKLEADAARLDWIARDGDSHVFFIADTWYSRTAYGQPYRKCLNLRDALDKAMEATND